MPFTTLAFETAYRGAAVQMLEDFRTDSGISFGIYAGRPRTIKPPHAWVDLIRERVTLSGPLMRTRSTSGDIVVVHGTFDSADTVAQRDRWVDGFLDWLLANPHAAGSQTLLGDVVEVADEPDFVPSWLSPADQQAYFATRITVAGYVGG